MRQRSTLGGLRAVAVSPLIACIMICLLSVAAYPQEDIDPTIPTLRVYTNVLQIPTLVLDSRHRPILKIAESRFRISIDGGPKSRIAHARLEGEDPLALAILVDEVHLPGEVRSRIPEAIAALAPGWLRATDSVLLYDLNCQLSRAVVAKPTSAAALGETARLLFAPERTTKSHGGQACARAWNLLDAIVAAVRGLENEPGRRVLLVLSDGQDHGSRTTWDDARVYSTQKGVAVFASIPPSTVNMPLFGPRGIVGQQAVSAPTDLPSLCESTGGMALDDTGGGVRSVMRDFVTQVRNRYIIEFPRPDTGAGNHSMDISVDKLNAFIRPAGASVPLPDPELAKDPNTIISGPENAPAVGTKRPKQ